MNNNKFYIDWYKQYNGKSIYHLLVLLKDEYINNINTIGLYGLCSYVEHLYYKDLITDNESIFLDLYIKNNKPEGFKRHIPYYWNVRNSKARIEWLDKHIKLNKDENNEKSND